MAAPAGALAGTAPVLIGSISNSTSLAGSQNVAVSGHYAYTTAYWPGELTVLDVSNPASPSIVGSTPATTSLENGDYVLLSGNYAFVTSKNRNQSCLPGPPPSCSQGSNDDGSGNSLTVIDITNPASPSVVGSVHDGNELFGAYSVAVSGHYAFVAAQGILSGQPGQPATSTGDLAVLDLNALGTGVIAHIDNNSLPTPWAGKNILDHPTSIAIYGTKAYLTSFYSGHLTIIDISSPTAPTITGSVADWTHLAYDEDLAVQGQYLYVADQTSGSADQLVIYSLATPSNPRLVGALSDGPVLNNAYRIRVRGSFAYIPALNASTVAAVDISNPAAPRVAGYLTDPTHLHSVSGLDLDSSGRYVIASSASQPGQGGTYPPFTNSTGTISVIDLIPNPISATIAPGSEPSNPTSQTSANFSFSPGDDVSTALCSLDGAALGPCTTPTSQNYSSLPIGSHTFTVQVADATGNTASQSYTWTVGTAPQNTSAPQITGTLTVGQTLTASSGTWTGYPTPTYGYQWSRCDANGQNCSAILNATNPTYVLQPVDSGSTLEVMVTATNSLGSVPASAVTGIVGQAPQLTGPPQISGTTAVGQTLTASDGTWSGSPAPRFAFQWRRCDQNAQNCNAIAGATSQAYVLAAPDAGSTIEVVVTATNSVGSAQGNSSATTIVTGPPQGASAPQISGNPSLGQTLSASTGGWYGYPAPSFAYQWLRCNQSGQSCNSIAGAAASSYVAVSADVGRALEVTVTATNASGTGSATSAAAGPVNGPPGFLSKPTVTGQPIQGSTLAAGPGTWTGYPPPVYTYQWVRCTGPIEGSCVAIAQATATTYTVAAADVGFRLRVLVHASNSSGSAQRYSLATAIVTTGASGSGTGLASGHASLSIRLAPDVKPALIKQLTLALPAGLRVTRAKLSAITVRNLRGKRLRFTVRLVRNTVTIKLAVPSASAVLFIRGGLTVSPALVDGVRRGTVKRLKMVLSWRAVGRSVQTDRFSISVR